MIRIIIDLRPLLYNFVPQETARFIYDTHYRISAEYPEQEWLFLVDQSYTEKKLPAISARQLLVKKSLPGQLGWKIWYDWQLPQLIKQQKAHLLINTGGVAVRAPVAQCMWMPVITGKHTPKKDNAYADLYKRRLTASIQKVSAVFVFSEEQKKELLQQYKAAWAKVEVIAGAPDERAVVIPWTEKENAKISFAKGREYFAVAGITKSQQAIDLLKAFSQFKKRQQSNMQLVFAPGSTGYDIDFAEKLEHYKYRYDVFAERKQGTQEKIKVISGAYALIYSGEEGAPWSTLLNSLKAGVAVIAANGYGLKEIAGDAVLYADFDNPESVALQLMTIYKDEALRDRLVGKAMMHVQSFSISQIPAQVYGRIVKSQDKY